MRTWKSRKKGPQDASKKGDRRGMNGDLVLLQEVVIDGGDVATDGECGISECVRGV